MELFVKIFLLILASAMLQNTNANAFVRLYEHADWKGDNILLAVGGQCMNLGQDWEDKASSVAINEGRCAGLFIGRFCTGNVLVIRGSYSYLGDNFNDKVKSVGPC